MARYVQDSSALPQNDAICTRFFADVQDGRFDDENPLGFAVSPLKRGEKQDSSALPQNDGMMRKNPHPDKSGSPFQ